MPVVLQPTYGLDYYWDIKPEEQVYLDQLTVLPYDLSLNLSFKVNDPADASDDAIPNGPWGATGCTGSNGYIADPISEIDRRTELEKKLDLLIRTTKEEIKVLKNQLTQYEKRLDQARAHRHRSVPREVTLSFSGVLATQMANQLKKLFSTYVSLSDYTDRVRSDQPDPNTWRDNHECDEEYPYENSTSCYLCTLNDEDLIGEVDCHIYSYVVDPDKTKINCQQLPFQLWKQLIELLEV
jgi:hypothetical protein